MGGLTSRTAAPARAWQWRPSVEPAPAEEADRRWDVLLLCIAGYLLTSVGRVHQLFPVLEYLRPGMLTGGLGLLIFLFGRPEAHRSRDVFVPTTKILIALLFWMVLSVPLALSQGRSFDMVVDDFGKTVVMYLVVVGAVRGLRDVERLAAVYLLAATAYSVVVLCRFDLGGGDDWRLGRLYYYDANDFATFAVTAMPFGLYFLHAGRRALHRVLGAAALGTLALALVWTGSRGGFLALLAVTLFVVVRYTGVPLRWRLSVTALVALVFLATASEQYWRQMGTIVEDSDYNRTDETGRLQIWQRGVGYMLQNPILGVGANNFGAAEGLLSPFAYRQQFGVGVRWSAPHNSFVQVGAELGIPGLVLFVAFIASAFRALRHSDASLTRALTASLIGYVVGAFFLSLAYSAILYTLVALAVGLRKVTRAPQVVAAPAPAPAPHRWRAGASLAHSGHR
jgi:putative inorganic carbon (HCO3(-)) transporter